MSKDRPKAQPLRDSNRLPKAGPKSKGGGKNRQRQPEMIDRAKERANERQAAANRRIARELYTTNTAAMRSVHRASIT